MVTFVNFPNIFISLGLMFKLRIYELFGIVFEFVFSENKNEN